MDKAALAREEAEEAKRYHRGHGVTCRTCKHWREGIVFGKSFSHCAFQHSGRVLLGLTGDEYCSLWEGWDDAEGSL